MKAAGTGLVSWRPLARAARPQAHLMLLGCAFKAVASILQLRFVSSLGGLVDDIVAAMSGDGQLSVMAGQLLAMAICMHTGASLVKVAGERVAASVSSTVFGALVHRDCTFFDAAAIGDLCFMLSNDTAALLEVMSSHVPTLLISAGAVILAILQMILISPKLAVLAAAGCPLVGLEASIVGSWVATVHARVVVTRSGTMALANESLTAVRDIKAFGHEALVLQRFQLEVEACCRLACFQRMISELWQCCNLILGSVIGLGAVWVGSWAVQRGELTAGQLSSFFIYGLSCGFSANDVANAYTKVISRTAEAHRTVRLLSEAGEAQSGQHAIPPAAPRDLCDLAPSGEAACGDELSDGKSGGGGGCAVRFVDVSFSYMLRMSLPPAAPSDVGCDACHDGGGSSGVALALCGINVDIAAGHMAALVGPSGGGKSSILNLLLRFYAPLSGNIFLGGRELSKIDARALRQMVSVVPQSPILLRGTFASVIGFGANDDLLRRENLLRQGGADGEAKAVALRAREIKHVAGLSHADGFISEAGGYDAPVSELGSNLSGGQRQRLALARALLRRPQLLLLDEATSALDAESERVVHEAFRASPRAAADSEESDQTAATFGGRGVGRPTTVIAAHRLSTVSCADEILVLQGGKITEQGSHAELMKHEESWYARMCALQGIEK